eukprot:1067902-Alexandrium_andersonii.AAC.1
MIEQQCDELTAELATRDGSLAELTQKAQQAQLRRTQVTVQLEQAKARRNELRRACGEALLWAANPTPQREAKLSAPASEMGTQPPA